MDQRVARILSSLPGWDGAEIVVTPLIGGITNQNFRLDIRGESFVLRVGGKGTQLLGIDRGRERTCTALAAQVGVGAEVMHFLPSEDALVTRYIEGAILSSEAAVQPAMLARIVKSLHRYHGIASFPGSFSPFETVRGYHALALERGVIFPDELPRVFALMERIEQALSSRQQLRACHNDLL